MCCSSRRGFKCNCVWRASFILTLYPPLEKFYLTVVVCKHIFFILLFCLSTNFYRPWTLYRDPSIHTEVLKRCCDADDSSPNCAGLHCRNQHLLSESSHKTHPNPAENHSAFSSKYYFLWYAIGRQNTVRWISFRKNLSGGLCLRGIEAPV